MKFFKRQIYDRRKNGGKIFTEKTVDKVIVSEDKTAQGVIVDGKMEKADAVILSVPANGILSLIPNDLLPRTFVENLRVYVASCGIVMDIVGIPSNLLPSGKFDTVLNLNPPAILRLSSKYDRSIAQPEKDILTAWMPIRSDEIQERDMVESKFALLSSIIKEIFPGALEKSEFHRRMIFDNVIGRYPLMAPLVKKIPVELPGISSLYFVGDAADADGIGGSSDASFTSAIKCTNLIEKAFREETGKRIIVR